MMTKRALPLLLLFSVAPAFAANLSGSCPTYTPPKDKAKWEWMDSGCNPRTRSDLDRILANHKLWIQKYGPDLQGTGLQSEAALLAQNAFDDPLRADLSGAQLRRADLTGQNLEYADLSGGTLDNADLTRARLDDTDLTGAHFEDADLNSAVLVFADLSGATLDHANLTAATLDNADLAGASLSSADLTRASFVQGDFTGSNLQGTDLSDADLTRAWLEDAVYEPGTQPPANNIARADGIETLRWAESLNESGCLTGNKISDTEACGKALPRPATFADGWLLWLSWRRDQLAGKAHAWLDDAGFLWSDLLFVLHHKVTKQQSGAAASQEQEESDSTRTQGKYPLIDMRTALKNAGYSEAELLLNLAYQRHTQSTLEMIVFDWTCAYGTAPMRPLILALVLALIAIPIYWLGFRHRLFGTELHLVEQVDDREVDLLVGDAKARPNWQVAPHREASSIPIEEQKNRNRVYLLVAEGWFRLRLWVRSCWPRVRWEIGFLKTIVLFSLISIINLGFEGLDFGRWMHSLTFREYELNPLGWLRTVSGAQSLVGLGLLALSLLSFFGHRFE